jgi:hypothetical protein
MKKAAGIMSSGLPDSKFFGKLKANAAAPVLPRVPGADVSVESQDLFRHQE